MNFLEQDYKKPMIAGALGEKIPISTIYCIGQNYVRHIEELSSVSIGKPLIFMKPATAIVENGAPVHLPSYSRNVHHEVELTLIFGKEGKHIPETHVSEYIWGYTVALDLTLRDIQTEAKKSGGPWAIAKGFDTSCPIARAKRFSSIQSLTNYPFYLEKNGTLVQHGNTALMIFNIPFLVSFLSRHFTIKPGDLLLTGTPEGVGPIQPGDTMTFWGDDIEKTTVSVQEEIHNTQTEKL